MEHVLITFAKSRGLEIEKLIEARVRMGGYIEKLNAAGKTDISELAAYGLAYLCEMHEGPGAGYTGC